MIITVTQLNNFIKGVLDCEPMLSNVSVKGEVINLSINRDTANFSLRDENSQIDCFVSNLKIVNFSNGDEIVVSAKPNFYTKGGRLSLYVSSARPPEGLGEQYKQFLLLKEKLEKEGCFSSERKRPVNRFAQNIGIVTSSTGAVINDLKKVIWERNPSVQIKLIPVKVQGEGAEKEIADAICFFNNVDVDTVIVARGGGSQTELMTFNSEQIVRAICRCNKPVISAVGHENDFTLCDFASDLRAATPSVAGELATINAKEIKITVKQTLEKILRRNMERANDNYRKVQLCIANLRLRQTESINESKQKITGMLNRMYNLETSRLSAACNEAQLQLEKLNSRNPLLVLKQGYAAATKDGKRVSSAKQLKKQDKISLTFADGKVKATVDEVESKK